MAQPRKAEPAPNDARNPLACARTCCSPKIDPRPRQVFRSSANIPLTQTFRYKFCVTYIGKGSPGLSAPLMNLAEYTDARRDQHLVELHELLRIPSISAKSEDEPAI